MAERPKLYLPYYLRAKPTLQHLVEVHHIPQPTNDAELGREPQRYHRTLHEGPSDKLALPHEHVLFAPRLEPVTRDFQVYPLYTDTVDVLDHLLEDHFVPPGLPVSRLRSFGRFHSSLHRTDVQDHVHRHNGKKNTNGQQ